MTSLPQSSLFSGAQNVSTGAVNANGGNDHSTHTRNGFVYTNNSRYTKGAKHYNPMVTVGDHAQGVNIGYGSEDSFDESAPAPASSSSASASTHWQATAQGVPQSSATQEAIGTLAYTPRPAIEGTPTEGRADQRTLTLIVFLDTAAMFDSSRELRLGDMPEDIGRMIFESITESDRKTGFSCALVSRKVNLCWVASQNLLDFIAAPELAPRRLYIGSKLFHDHQRHFSHAIFQNATHLELICQRDFGDSLKEQWDWSTLRYLTNLTHLSVYFEPTWERASYAECVERTISACPQSLRVFVAWLMVGGPVSLRDGLRAIQEGYLDERVVLGYVAWTHVGINTGSHPYTLVRSYEDMDNGTYQWDAAADDCSESEGGESMWALAEDIIEKRRTRKALQDDETS
ncbi:hypothetical protein MD484_g4058, partial [Candolleomyces efflorescens]